MLNKSPASDDAISDLVVFEISFFINELILKLPFLVQINHVQ